MLSMALLLAFGSNMPHFSFGCPKHKGIKKLWNLTRPCHYLFYIYIFERIMTLPNLTKKNRGLTHLEPIKWSWVCPNWENY